MLIFCSFWQKMWTKSHYNEWMKTLLAKITILSHFSLINQCNYLYFSGQREAQWRDVIYPKGWQQRQRIPEPKSRAWRIIYSVWDNLSIRWDSLLFYVLHTVFYSIDFIHVLYYYWKYCSINDQNTSVFFPDTSFPKKFCQKINFLQSIYYHIRKLWRQRYSGAQARIIQSKTVRVQMNLSIHSFFHLLSWLVFTSQSVFLMSKGVNKGIVAHFTTACRIHTYVSET